MKAYASIYESQKNVMNRTRKMRSLWKLEYNTLTRLLHDSQTVTGWKLAEPIFKELQLPMTRKVSRKDVESMIHVWYEDKKGNRFPAYIVEITDKDENGEPLKDKNGNEVVHYETRPVRDGHWTMDAISKVLACSNNARDDKKKK